MKYETIFQESLFSISVDNLKRNLLSNIIEYYEAMILL